MELKTLYFGLISEITNCTEEMFSVPANCDTIQLEALLKEKYNNLHNVSFKIAVDQNIVTTDFQLTPSNEIAVLPPFAGG